MKNVILQKDILNPLNRISLYGDHELTSDAVDFEDLKCFMHPAGGSVESTISFKDLLKKERNKQIYSGPTPPEDSMGSDGDIYIMY